MKSTKAVVLVALANHNFIDRYRRRYGAGNLPCVYAETAYFQVHVLVRALNHSTIQSPEMLLDAIQGMGFDAPQGRITIDADNNHVYVTPRLGISTEEGTFDIVWESPEAIKPDPYLVAYDRIRDGERHHQCRHHLSETGVSERSPSSSDCGYFVIPHGEETLARMHGGDTPPDFKEVFAIGPFDCPDDEYHSHELSWRRS